MKIPMSPRPLSPLERLAFDFEFTDVKLMRSARPVNRAVQFDCPLSVLEENLHVLRGCRRRRRQVVFRRREGERGWRGRVAPLMLMTAKGFKARRRRRRRRRRKEQRLQLCGLGVHGGCRRAAIIVAGPLPPESLRVGRRAEHGSRRRRKCAVAVTNQGPVRDEGSAVLMVWRRPRLVPEVNARVVDQRRRLRRLAQLDLLSQPPHVSRQDEGEDQENEDGDGERAHRKQLPVLREERREGRGRRVGVVLSHALHTVADLVALLGDAPVIASTDRL